MDARIRRDAPSCGRLDFAAICDRDGFAALETEWRALFGRCAAPRQVFQSHSFLRHWARHFVGPRDRLEIITVREAGRLRAILPLLRKRRFGATVLQLAGSPVAQFADVLLDEGLGDDALRSIREHIEGLQADLFVARKVRADAALMCVMPDGAVRYDGQQAPHADLASRVCGDGPGAAYPPRQRSSYRRRLRRLAEQGEVGFVSIGPGAEAARLSGIAIDMKRCWLSAQAIHAPTVLDPRFAAFFADMAGDAESETPLFATTITIAGQPVAVDLSFDFAGASFGHIHATAPESRVDGAGQLLVHATFQASRERGNSRFELMAPADAYKLQHADGVVDVADFALGFTPWGRALSKTLPWALPTARTALRFLPGGAARVLTRKG
jgi:CelD/BcsL family acetyltransferase involved in cellulose biosynthesis